MSNGAPDPGPRFESGWRQRFAHYARLYQDDAGIAGWTATSLEARLRFFARHWAEGGVSGLWVDLGCGAGTYARWLVQAGQSVVGVDYSLPTLEKARDRSPDAIDWVVGDASNLPLGAGSADGILCLGVTQALGGSEPLLDELARVTRRGGVVWVDGLNSWCLPHMLSRLKAGLGGAPSKVRYASPWRLRRQVRHAGFENARLFWLPILPERWGRFQPWLEHPATVALLHALPPLGAMLSHSMVVIARREDAHASG